MAYTRKTPGGILERSKEVIDIERRFFMGRTLSLGALAMLSGCNVEADSKAQSILNAMSKWNDGVQAAIFGSNMAPTYTEAQITNPFPFNAYYSEDEAPVVNGADWKLQLSGLIENKTPWTLQQLAALPQESQITRHICVEGWSAIGQWSGVPLRDFLTRVGADLKAQYVGFRCADDYFTSLDMATALHPQTIIALNWRDQQLPRAYGFPIKIRVPTKLGFKNPKYVTEMFVTNTYPGGYWENQGYNWFSGS